MNRILMRMMGVLLGFVALVAANPLSATITAGNYDFTMDRVISSTTALDTLAASDSSTLITNWNPDRGYEYILVRDAITGTGSDSVAMQVTVDNLDGNGTLLYRAVVDTFSAAAGEAVLLPIGATCIGHKYRLKLVTYTGAGTQAIVNRVYLYKRSSAQRTAPR